jgi:hypothetical protein
MDHAACERSNGAGQAATTRTSARSRSGNGLAGYGEDVEVVTAPLTGDGFTVALGVGAAAGATSAAADGFAVAVGSGVGAGVLVADSRMVALGVCEAVGPAVLAGSGGGVGAAHREAEAPPRSLQELPRPLLPRWSSHPSLR